MDTFYPNPFGVPHLPLNLFMATNYSPKQSSESGFNSPNHSNKSWLHNEPRSAEPVKSWETPHLHPVYRVTFGPRPGPVGRDSGDRSTFASYRDISRVYWARCCLPQATIVPNLILVPNFWVPMRRAARSGVSSGLREAAGRPHVPGNSWSSSGRCTKSIFDGQSRFITARATDLFTVVKASIRTNIVPGMLQ